LEGEAQISPDSHLVTYVSDESGRNEVYIRDFPTGESKWQVSPKGGSQPRWRRDGQELYYIAQLMDRATLMAVRVNRGARQMVSAPERLFEYPNSTVLASANVFGYSPSADGKRFLVNRFVEEPHPTLKVLVNWPEMVRRGAR
jgi:protease II